MGNNISEVISAVSASFPGRLHRNTERENEDSVRLEKIPEQNGIVAAVSDGAGSSSMARHASRRAANTAVAVTLAALEREDTSLEEAVKAGISEARDAVMRMPEDEPTLEPGDCHCTLILVAWLENEVAAVQIGDGAVAEKDSTFKMLTIPQRGEYANETFFLNGDYYEDILYSRTAEDITALVMFSDGLQGEAVDFRNKKPRAEFLEKIMQKALEGEETFREWLEEEHGNINDDVSIVVAWNSPRNGESPVSPEPDDDDEEGLTW